jgi:hypothetical protein
LGNWAKSQKFRKAIDNEIIENVQQRGGNVQHLPRGFMLRINDELSVSTSVARLITTEHNDRRWIFGYKSRQRPDVLIVARAAEERECLRDYFLLPYLLIDRHWLTFSDGNDARLEPFQTTSLIPLFELFAREPIQQLANGRDQCLTLARDSFSASKTGTIWPSAPIEDSISSVINMLRNILSDGDFTGSITVEGLRSMPRLLKTPTSTLRVQGKFYGASVLEFAVVWAFVSRLIANPKIASRLNRDWPEFTSQMKMTYLSVLAKGPFARLSP